MWVALKHPLDILIGRKMNRNSDRVNTRYRSSTSGTEQQNASANIPYLYLKSGLPRVSRQGPLILSRGATSNKSRVGWTRFGVALLS
ncbi:hypothetical protein HanPSC8_Chr15g0666501 [Helianthus annuus]|nr:hypothetical protein HanPSC8_Chr15g0666501 [Helianthus annuus]